MKRILGAVLAVVATSGAAFAADVLVKAPPVYKAPVSTAYSWTGLYIGGHIGGAWANNDWSFPFDSLNSVVQEPICSALAPGCVTSSTSSGSNTASGWLLGGQIGYNYQLKNNWVLGIEGDASWSSLKGSNKDPSFSTINQTQTDFIGTLAGRVGYAWDRLLVYGKGGGAWANNKYSVISTTTFTVGNGSPAPVSVYPGMLTDGATVNRFGYMLGAGIEYALTPQWSVKAEYQYLNFGTQRTTLSTATTVVSPFDEDIKQTIQVAEIGFNYKLDPTGQATWAASHPIFDQIGQATNTPRFYAGSDYLLWWVKGAPLSIPLVTTGPTSNHEGILNSSATTILYGASYSPAQGGNDTQNFNALSGVRLRLGYWLNNYVAVEAGGFVLQQGNGNYYLSSDSTGNPGFGIPVYNSILYLPEGHCPPNQPTCGTGVGEDRTPISIPGELYGSVAITNSLNLWGLNANGVVNFMRTPNWDVSALVGVRYLNLSENFNLWTNLTGTTGLSTSFFSGMSGYTDDDFNTRNQFYGGLLGLRAHGTYGRFSVETTETLALGVNHETINIYGYYDSVGFSISTSGNYGIFAVPQNSGITSSNKFAVVPEAQIKLGYDITPSITVTVGYDFLYISNVVRPTDQIDRNVIKGQFFQEDPGSTSTSYPQRLDKTTDFYAQGVSVGLSARF